MPIDLMGVEFGQELDSKGDFLGNYLLILHLSFDRYAFILT